MSILCDLSENGRESEVDANEIKTMFKNHVFFSIFTFNSDFHVILHFNFTIKIGLKR